MAEDYNEDALGGLSDVRLFCVTKPLIKYYYIAKADEEELQGEIDIEYGDELFESALDEYLQVESKRSG
jgi:hypothetical protein